MDPSTLLIGKGIDALGMIGGRFLGGASIPNVSSATAIGGTISAPFNVGGGIGGAGGIGAAGPLVIVGLVLWLLLKK